MGAGQSKELPVLGQPPSPSSPGTHKPSLDVEKIDAQPSPSQASSAGANGGGGGCPMKNADGSYRMAGLGALFGMGGRHPKVDADEVIIRNEGGGGGSGSDQVARGNDSASSTATGESAPPPADGRPSGCPVKRDGGSSGSWNIFRRARPPGGAPGEPSRPRPESGESACPVRSTSGSGVQYDVYSRPVPMDPANNMPLANPSAAARNALPSPGQTTSLPTERVSSTIPKTAAGGTMWTYPSPQMFYNALARKGKLDDGTSEDDMEAVVALHNVMNEGTWERVLQWERVLAGGDGEGDVSGPSLTKFMGRPTDLSPKAAFKHYILGHPLPFDRHDWTVTRTNPDGSTQDVRYVIDYYHDDEAADESEGSGLVNMKDGIGEGGRVRSLLVDVRPAADGPAEIWGRTVSMPLARRGCRSLLECVLFKGEGNARERSDFVPLPMSPSESLRRGLGESKEVWSNIQKDAAEKKGVGAKDGGGPCASDPPGGAGTVEAGDVSRAARSGRESVDGAPADVDVPESEARELAAAYSRILSGCAEQKAALRDCSSEDECKRAFTGMTVCAGRFMCPLQHGSLMESLAGIEGGGDDELSEAKVNAAFDILGECVTSYDARAAEARRYHPGVFDEALKEGR